MSRRKKICKLEILLGNENVKRTELLFGFDMKTFSTMEKVSSRPAFSEFKRHSFAKCARFFKISGRRHLKTFAHIILKDPLLLGKTPQVAIHKFLTDWK